MTLSNPDQETKLRSVRRGDVSTFVRPIYRAALHVGFRLKEL